jgi:protein TonB
MSSSSPSPLASLDDSLTLLRESLGKLKAAKSVEMAEVIEQLNMAAESARIVRAWVSSELPDASWQNREELDALLAEIQKIVEARTLQQLRSRVLALATELERGSIVHRRALRINELHQLRDQAINELRSQASLEGAPPTLPGPEAEQWVEWACGLKDPEDAESLRTLRNGFAHLDDFVANLEPSMWVAGGSPTLETLPEPERTAAKAQPEQSRRETSGFKPVVSGPLEIGSKPAESSEGRHQPQFPRSADGQSLTEFESNTLTPFDVSPPRTEGELQGIHDQERALQARVIGLVTNPARHFNSPVAPPFTEEVFRETSGALAIASHPVESPNTDEAFREKSAVPAIASHSVESPFTPDAFREKSAAPAIASNIFESPFTDEAFREARAARASTRHPVEITSRAKVSRKVRAAPPITSDLRTRVAELSGRQWRMLLVAIAMLVFASLTAIQWRSNRTRTSSGSLKTIETKTPDLTRNNPENKVKGNEQPGMSTDTEMHTFSPKSPTKEAAKPKDQSVAPKPLAKASSAKQAGNRDDGVLHPPAAIPVVIAKQEAPPSGIPGVVPGGLANGAPASVINIMKDIPVAEPKIAAQKARVSSGVAQGLLVHQVLPRYPQQARQAHVEGTVVLQVLIGKDGTVQSLRVVSGHPMLNVAATDAVKQWRYKPYYLNGEPAEADTQINVKFTLPPGG